MNAKKVINAVITDAKSTIQDAKDLAAASVALTKMKAADKASSSIANTVAYVLLGVVALYIVLFAGITLGFALGSWLDNNAWGFLIVTGIFAILAAIILPMKNRLIKLPVLNALLDKFFNKEDKNNESGERLKRI